MSYLVKLYPRAYRDLDRIYRRAYENFGSFLRFPPRKGR